MDVDILRQSLLLNILLGDSELGQLEPLHRLFGHVFLFQLGDFEQVELSLQYKGTHLVICTEPMHFVVELTHLLEDHLEVFSDSALLISKVPLKAPLAVF